MALQEQVLPLGGIAPDRTGKYRSDHLLVADPQPLHGLLAVIRRRAEYHLIGVLTILDTRRRPGRGVLEAQPLSSGLDGRLLAQLQNLSLEARLSLGIAQRGSSGAGAGPR